MAATKWIGSSIVAVMLCTAMSACGGESGGTRSPQPARARTTYQPGMPTYDDIVKDLQICKAHVAETEEEAKKTRYDEFVASARQTRANHMQRSGSPMGGFDFIDAVQDVCAGPDNDPACCSEYKKLNATGALR